MKKLSFGKNLKGERQRIYKSAENSEKKIIYGGKPAEVIRSKKEFHDVYKDFLDAKIKVRKLTSNEIEKHTQGKHYTDTETVDGHNSNIEMQNQTKKLDSLPDTRKSESDEKIQEITPKHNTMRTHAENKIPTESFQTRSGRKIVPSAKVLEASGQSGKSQNFLIKMGAVKKNHVRRLHRKDRNRPHSTSINDGKHGKGKGKQKKVTTPSHTDEKEKTILTRKTKNVEKEENSGSPAKRIKLQVSDTEVTKEPETTPITYKWQEESLFGKNENGDKL
ncbi:unnamed protein product [Mytilus edulis]|uniref:Uncharacterized protein n=1 Tax=Mytilus edulis TaxID=6550 RepID=A0A8S3REU3_MYTED|nr:unnamed protein product [Mytilus edulis]